MYLKNGGHQAHLGENLSSFEGARANHAKNGGPNESESCRELMKVQTLDLVWPHALSATLAETRLLSSNLNLLKFLLRVAYSFLLFGPRLYCHAINSRQLSFSFGRVDDSHRESEKTLVQLSSFKLSATLSFGPALMHLNGITLIAEFLCGRMPQSEAPYL